MINSKKRPDLMRVLITYEPAETKTNLGWQTSYSHKVPASWYFRHYLQ
jgi:hypothetical protein